MFFLPGRHLTLPEGRCPLLISSYFFCSPYVGAMVGWRWGRWFLILRIPNGHSMKVTITPETYITYNSQPPNYGLCVQVWYTIPPFLRWNNSVVIIDKTGPFVAGATSSKQWEVGLVGVQLQLFDIWHHRVINTGNHRKNPWRNP